MRRRRAGLVLGLIAALAGAARAEPQTLVLDPARSEVRFDLAATLHTVHGTARLLRGEIRFDSAGGAASGEVVVDARSARTGIERRDRVMHAEVLESELHPTIALRPERLELASRDASSARVRLLGALEIHGASHPVELPADVREQGGWLVLETSFRVPYAEWGMKDVSNPLLRVAREVQVHVRAEGRLATLPPPEEATEVP